MTKLSVQPAWCLNLPLQQQSVLMLAARGPDGIAKHHPCKNIVRAYRGTVLLAAKYGRSLNFGEKADTFMSLDRIASPADWLDDIKMYFDHVDELPHHYHLHLLHGAQILGYKHPSPLLRRQWFSFYLDGVKDSHMNVETENEMDYRLNDWNREEWS